MHARRDLAPPVLTFITYIDVQILLPCPRRVVCAQNLDQLDKGTELLPFTGTYVRLGHIKRVPGEGWDGPTLCIS